MKIYLRLSSNRTNQNKKAENKQPPHTIHVFSVRISTLCNQYVTKSMLTYYLEDVGIHAPETMISAVLQRGLF